MEFQPGDRAKLVQDGTLQVGGITLSDNTVDSVVVVAKNPDGSYLIDLRQTVNAPGMDRVSVPADWLHPPS